MTKDDERQLVDDTIEALPPSYLRDILITEKPAILDAILTDLGFIDLAAISRQIVEERQTLKDVRAEIETPKRELRDAHGMQSRLEDSIREIRTTARRMAAC